MLAKDIKIRLLRKQYDFIQERLNKMTAALLRATGKDVHPVYIHDAYIFPEVMQKLQENNPLLTVVVDDDGIYMAYAFINSNAQRIEIEECLNDVLRNDDCDPVFTYPSYITDANRKYFEEQGYTIEKQYSNVVTFPVHVFKIDESRTKLSPEELIAAEEYEYDDDNDDTYDDDDIDDGDDDNKSWFFKLFKND